MTSSKPAPEAPVSLRIRLYRQLWKIAAGVGGFIVLSLGGNLFATWLTSSKGRIPADSPLLWLADKWFIVLPIGVCFLLLALLFRIGSSFPAQAAPSSLTQQNRAHMLGRLRRSYLDLLDHSLQETSQIKLGLAQIPNAVQNVTNRLTHLSHQTEQILPPGTSIVRVYEDAEQELLILGEPGAGKSTLLLYLALELVQRAEQQETYPLPVIVPLSSWAEHHRALEDWLSEQVALIYDAPRAVTTQWVRNEQILPLLDGLDEMDENYRPACIAAINAYHQNHLVPLVVCSRRAEYEDAARRQQLRLQDAVLIQPLTSEQVVLSLEQIGKPLAALRSAFKKNPALQELATTPLMLHVMILTYWKTSMRELPRNTPLLQKQIWADYVQRVLEGKQQNAGKRYTMEQTRAWLGWLAQQMRFHKQTIFYLEQLQPDWLAKERRWLYLLGIGLFALPIGLPAGLIFGLVFGLFDGPLDELVGAHPFGLFKGLPLPSLVAGALPWFVGLVFGLMIWLAFGLAFLTIYGLYKKIEPVEMLTWSRRNLRWGLLPGLIFGLAIGSYSGLIFGPSFGVPGGLTSGLVFGLSIWFLSGFSQKRLSRRLTFTPNEGIRRSIKNGLLTWLLAGLTTILFFVLIVGQIAELFNRLIEGLVAGLATGMTGGLSGGLYFGLLFGLATAIQHYNLRFWLWRTHLFPWKAQRFLDDAVARILLRRVGGGYSFVHQLLLGYFADLDAEPGLIPAPQPTDGKAI